MVRWRPETSCRELADPALYVIRCGTRDTYRALTADDRRYNFPPENNVLPDCALRLDGVRRSDVGVLKPSSPIPPATTQAAAATTFPAG